MYKTGSEFRWGNDNHEALQSEVGSSSLQWCEGKMMPFSVGSYIMGPDTTPQFPWHNLQTVEVYQ
jgi:hypothetical protein